MSLYKKNETFQFVVYRENFLSSDECDKLIKTLDKDLTEGTIVGDYTTDKVNGATYYPDYYNKIMLMLL